MDEVLPVTLALGSAAILGGLIGLDRELHGRWAGMRTHMLVAMGAAVFVRAGGAALAEEGVTRIIQGIAAGIGFIGAGTVLKLTDRLEVKGLTTASSVWLAAALGTACGTGRYVVAALATLFTVIILSLLGMVERLLTSKKTIITVATGDPPPRPAETTGTRAG